MWKHHRKWMICSFLIFLLLLAGCEKEGEKETETQGVWNPYSTEDNHLYTLNDFLLSASGGKHIVKMTVTIALHDAESMYRFLGYGSPEPPEEAGHGGDHVPSPMEIEVNSLISQAMMELDEEKIKDVAALETALRDYLNTHLASALGEKEEEEEETQPFIKGVNIENFILQ